MPCLRNAQSGSILSSGNSKSGLELTEGATSWPPQEGVARSSKPVCNEKANSSTNDMPEVQLCLLFIGSCLTGFKCGCTGLEGARASGKCTNVFLHVREKDSPALALYEKAGFTLHRKESVPGGVFGMIRGRRPQTLMKYELS